MSICTYKSMKKTQGVFRHREDFRRKYQPIYWMGVASFGIQQGCHCLLP